MKKRELRLIGIDDWMRPVYQDQYKRMWKDVNLGEKRPALYSAETMEDEPGFPLEDAYTILIPGENK